MYFIRFYRTSDPYGCFSNLARYPICLGGKEWTSTEHYFQAQKFAGTPHEEEIRLAATPFAAAHMGRERHRPLRSDWDQVKEAVMRAAVKAKVEQHADVRSILLSTGDSELVEHTDNDAYWGDGGDGTGQNRLGAILMEVRQSLPEYDGRFYLPPWLAYPGVHPFSLHWRMGGGEDYIMKFGEWLNGLSAAARREYMAYFAPEPPWKGYWTNGDEFGEE